MAPVSGRLSVGINQTTDDTGDGNYAVRIRCSPVGGTRASSQQINSLPASIKISLQDPGRIADKEGNPRLFNFLMLGSEAAHAARFHFPLAGSRLTLTLRKPFSTA